MSNKIKLMTADEYKILLTDEINALHDRTSLYESRIKKEEDKINRYKNNLSKLESLYDKYNNRISDINALGEDKTKYTRTTDKELSRYIDKSMFYRGVLNKIPVKEFLVQELLRISSEKNKYNIYLINFQKKLDKIKKRNNEIKKILDFQLDKLRLVNEGEVEKAKSKRMVNVSVEAMRIMKSVHQSNYIKRRKK